MKICLRCTLSKDEREFRRKTSGPRVGFIFPMCMACEQELRDETIAAELRTRGYTCTKTTPPGTGVVADTRER